MVVPRDPEMNETFNLRQQLQTLLSLAFSPARFMVN